MKNKIPDDHKMGTAFHAEAMTTSTVENTEDSNI